MTIPSVHLSRATDPETSRDAGRAVDPRGSQAKVLRVFQASPSGRLTDKDLEAWLGSEYSPSRVRTARCELKRMGLVMDSGERRDGCIVWRLCP